MNANTFKELLQDQQIFEKILSSDINETFIPSILEKMKKKIQFWVSKVPAMLFPPPRLGEALREVPHFLFIYHLCFFFYFGLTYFTDFFFFCEDYLFYQ